MAKSKTGIKDLETKINAAAEAYYNGESVIEDSEYDSLLEELRQANPKHELLLKVGAKSTSSVWPKYKHKQPMGSLQKITTTDELEAWYKKYTSGKELLWADKLDGLSVDLEYLDGKLVRGVTRGDGVTGDDITKNVLKMVVPKEIPEKGEVLIRGEMMLPIKVWKKYFPNDKNPRNSVSGTSRRLDGSLCEHITIFAFSVIGTEEKTFYSCLETLVKWGFKTPRFGKESTLSKIEEVLNRTEEKRSELEYEIDGIVLTENNIERFLKEGETDSRPRAAKAFKFEAQQVTTTLLDVIWQVGRTGVITPVGVLKDVLVGGVTVSRVTLHNVEEINRLGVGINSEVVLKRAGDVIPKIVSSISKGKKIAIPTVCPSCGSPTVQDELRVSCVAGSSCPAQNQQVFLHYLDKLGVLGVGEAIIQKLMDAGKLTELPDLYKLKVDDISGLERLGDKVAIKIIKEIKEKSSGLTLAQLLSAVGIPGLSNKTLAKLFSKHKTIESVRKLGMKELMEVDSVGEVVATTIIDGLKKNNKIIDKLLKHVTIVAEVESTGPLVGIVFCFTGFRDAELSKKAKDKGAQESDSLTSSVTHLVAKDPTSGSSKMEKAKKNGTKILSIDDFKKLIS